MSPLCCEERKDLSADHGLLCEKQGDLCLHCVVKKEKISQLIMDCFVKSEVTYLCCVLVAGSSADCRLLCDGALGQE